MRSSLRVFVGFLFILGIVLLLVIGLEAGGETIIVSQDGYGDYSSIQIAINNANEGDTIRVYSGTYHENVIVDKTVTLIGKSPESTTIDGEGEGDVVTITADWVNISNFRVIGSGESWQNAGIIIDSNHNSLINNSCSDHVNGTGIYLSQDSHSNIISNNNCSNNGNIGVYVYWSEYNILMDNTFSNNYRGISLHWYSNYNTVTNNTCNGNYYAGISIAMYCVNNEINNNIL